MEALQAPAQHAFMWRLHTMLCDMNLVQYLGLGSVMANSAARPDSEPYV